MSPRSRALDSAQLAQLLMKAARDKLAWNPVLIDVRSKTSIAEYFVICEGETDRQVRAIADAMLESAREAGARPLGMTGYEDAAWVLLDFDSVLAHVFLPGERAYYDLESLWSAAERTRRSPARPSGPS